MNIKNNLIRLLVLFVFVFLMIPIVNVIADENVVETIQDTEASIKGNGYIIDATDKKIFLSSGAKVELTGNTEDYNIIVEENAVDVHITLNNYSGEDLSGWNSSHIIELRNGSSVTLTLVGENYLCSGREASAIRVPQNTSLVIDGDGSLDARVENYGSSWTSAVIGSEYNAPFGNITINSGNIYTHSSGGTYPTGIGSGYHGREFFDIEGTITLNGGNIHTQALGSRTNSDTVILAGNGNATVYSDNFLLKDDEFNGIVFNSDGTTGTVKGNATLSQDMEIPEGSVLTVEEDASLNIPPDVKVNNNGNIINKGTITNNGTLQNKGKINSTGKITSLTDIDNVEGNNVEIIYYDITIKTSYGGVSNPNKDFKSKHGESKTISIIPDDGYKIKSVIVNGKDMTNDVTNGELTLSNITENIYINVEFEKIDCDVTITVGNGGTITPDKDFKVKYGENATFNILPDDGYKIKSIVVNDNDMTNDVTNGELTLSNITENIYINVEFEEIDNINNPETYDNILFYVVLELVSIVGITLIIYFKKYIITK